VCALRLKTRLPYHPFIAMRNTLFLGIFKGFGWPTRLRGLRPNALSWFLRGGNLETGFCKATGNYTSIAGNPAGVWKKDDRAAGSGNFA